MGEASCLRCRVIFAVTRYVVMVIILAGIFLTLKLSLYTVRASVKTSWYIQQNFTSTVTWIATDVNALPGLGTYTSSDSI